MPSTKFTTSHNTRLENDILYMDFDEFRDENKWYNLGARVWKNENSKCARESRKL